MPSAYILRMTGVELDGKQDNENEFYLTNDNSWPAMPRWVAWTDARKFQTVAGAKAAYRSRPAEPNETVTLVELQTPSEWVELEVLHAGVRPRPKKGASHARV